MPAYIWILVTFTVFVIGFLLGIPFGHYLLSDLPRVSFEYLNSAGTWAGSLATTSAVVVSLYYSYREHKLNEPSLNINFVVLGPVAFINVVNTSRSTLYFHSALISSGDAILHLTPDFLAFDPPILSGLAPGQYYSSTLFSGDFQNYIRANDFTFSKSATFEFRTTIPASGSVVHLEPSDILSLTA